MSEMWAEWVKERNTEPPTYCPLERAENAVVLGMNFIGEPRGKVVGEFWFDDEGELRMELY